MSENIMNSMIIEKMYLTLDQRQRPEDVAEMVLLALGRDLTILERITLERAARLSLKRSLHGFTSMLQTFADVAGADKQVLKAIELFKIRLLNEEDYKKPSNIEHILQVVSPLILKEQGENNFLTDRLSKQQRKHKGLDISKRQYNKKWRALKRLEKKLHVTIREIKKLEFQKIAKHGLSHQLTLEEFASDLNSACFIAYYNARCNLRSVFTNQSQDKPFDEISKVLFNRCKGRRTKVFDFLINDRYQKQNNTNWWAIAHIYPSREVLSNLKDEEKGIFLGKWTTILQEIAELLDDVWTVSNMNRQTMIVKRGNDSTTWNNTAGAWNKARDSWMNLIYSLGMEYILDEVCFGKVLRLMAADVVAWHHSSSGKLDPNTDVWNKLPLPWEVFQGKENANKQLVIQYCNEAGLDPEKSGWIAPRAHGVAVFKPTPELVHGVAVSNPFLAEILKRQGCFSGKKC